MPKKSVKSTTIKDLPIVVRTIYHLLASLHQSNSLVISFDKLSGRSRKLPLEDVEETLYYLIDKCLMVKDFSIDFEKKEFKIFYK